MINPFDINGLASEVIGAIVMDTGEARQGVREAADGQSQNLQG